MRIVYVDDDPDEFLLLKKQLPEHKIIYFQDPLQSLPYIASEITDMLIVDLNIPKFSGWDVARCAHGLGHKGPICLLTGVNEEFLEHFKVPWLTILQKPLTKEMLNAQSTSN